MKKLYAQVDDILDALEAGGSTLDMRRAAVKFEALLGELERSGTETRLIEDAWRSFVFGCMDIRNYMPDEATPDFAKSGLQDNFFHVALHVADYKEDLIDQPVLAWAAFNKHSYSGYADEIAVTRLLLFYGFDPNLKDDRGMAPLHYMSWWKRDPYSSPRGVRLLLAEGADPNIQNANGDTPLSYLAGNRSWFPIMNESAILLLENGASPHIAANDGLTPLDVLKQSEADSPDENRAALIEVMEGVQA